MEVTSKTIGINIKKILQARGLSINEFAKNSCIPAAQIYNMIAGRSKNLKVLTSIAHALGIALDDLLTPQLNYNITNKNILFESAHYQKIVSVLSELLARNKWTLSILNIEEIIRIYYAYQSYISDEELELVLKGMVISVMANSHL